MCRPVAAAMSCTVMRNWSPERRRLPSSTCVAPSVAAILRTSMFLPLNANAEVRATTRSVGMCASQFESSSVRPSHKACSLWSTLMSTSGRTTMVGRFSAASSAWNNLPGMCQTTTARISASEDAAEPHAEPLDGRTADPRRGGR